MNTAQLAKLIADYAAGSNWSNEHILDLVHALASEPRAMRALERHVREMQDDLRRTGGV